MTIKCGFLNHFPTADKRDPDSSVFSGMISMHPMISGAVQLRPNLESRETERSPQYIVYYKPGTNVPWQQTGAAWIKQRNDNSGEFLSLTLDCPTWDAPLNLSAFPGDAKDESWPVVWRRKRGSNEQEA